MNHRIKSLLFVPAEARLLNKIGMISADAYIIDLEDSIKEVDKDGAVERTVDFLASFEQIDNLFVRINKNRSEKELELLQQFSVGFMLPKFEQHSDYSHVEYILKGRRVIALIESPKGLSNAEKIASLPWIDALAFGAEDYTAYCNMNKSYRNLSVFKSLLALAAKSNGKKVYDTPCFKINDAELIREELAQAFDLGYDGKLAIHPRQVDIINSFCECDEESIRKVVATYESSGKAVCCIDGVVYERMHIDQMKKMLSAVSNDI